MTTPAANSSPSSGSDIRLRQALTHWDQGPYMAFLRPVAEALVRAAGIRPGHRVLDVGTGFGDPALDIAAVVGPGGRVVGIDHDAPGLHFARQRAAGRGFHHVAFHEMDAQRLEFPDASFDAVVSRLVVIYFPNPVPVLREMWRVLVPGGRVAVAMWTQTERNPLLEVSFQVFRRYAPPVSAQPPTPDRMDVRVPGVLREAVERAGFEETAVSLVPLSVSLRPEDASAYWEERRAGSPASLQALARLTEAQQAAAEAEVIEALRRLIAEGRTTGEVAVATGVKPARG
ncbi:MAG: methyltransferase domain-containing protein [Chloroflexi bacterium]|nr:methyltransferase domain-containing protein [Chloroflexota bacterium]